MNARHPHSFTKYGDIEPDVTAPPSAQVAHQPYKHWRITADIFSLQNNTDHDTDYNCDSRVQPGAVEAEQIHFHPVEPIQVHFAVTAQF